ncbi:MAG: SBBP repeat-containing protein [Bryobacteraceae bacterium]|jgi:uncharacterized protein (TIGR03437 family)
MRLFFILALANIAIAGEFTTYIGDTYPRSVAAIAADAAGNTYVVGNRGNALTPTENIVFAAIYVVPVPVVSLEPAPNPPNDVFVSKLDPTGKILFTAVFAGKGQDQGLAVAVDPTGNVYVAGTTTSPDFPVSNALQSQNGQYGAGFIVKLSPDGKSILYSTYFGGLAGSTAINAMTTDAAGNLYLTGTTFATDFPHTSGMPSAVVAQNADIPLGNPISAAFVASISAAGDKILFSGTVGGTQFDCSGGPHDCNETISTTGVALALDAARNVYFGGNTNSTNLSTTAGAFLTQGIGAFAGKIAASGTGLAYLTYIGSAAEFAQGPVSTPANVLSSLTADSAGNAYLAGTTGDPNFPVTPGAFQTAFAGGPVNGYGIPASGDGFVAKLNPDGNSFVWATYLGGAGNDAVNSIAVDAAGDAWVTGTTASPTFPNVQGWSNGGDFLAEFSPSGATLPFAARYPNGTVAQAIALDTTTFIHTVGATGIVSEIASTGPPSAKIFGVDNVIGGPLAGRVAPAEVISIYGPHIGPATPVTAAPSGGFYPTTLGGVQVTIGGTPAPLLYVSEGQINAVVPMGPTIQSASAIQIASAGFTSASFPLWIDSSDGQLFPGILNQDGSLNSYANPAKLGSVVFFYATGFQTSFAPLVDGQIATQAEGILCVLGPCISASAGTVLYDGAAPGLVAGVTQINLQLNASGPQAVSVTGLQQVSILLENFNTFVTIWVTP